MAGPMTMSLFEDPSNIELSEEPVGPGATILRNFAISEETEILSGLLLRSQRRTILGAGEFFCIEPAFRLPYNRSARLAPWRKDRFFRAKRLGNRPGRVRCPCRKAP